MKYAIEMKEITKTYGKSRGIDSINLSVEEGDIFGYLGPNGAGKSTTIRCLLGMIYPDSGEAFVLGRQIGKEQTEILKKVGYMPSETMFYPSMRSSEVIKYAAKVRGMDCSDESERLCDRLEVDLNKKISELSLGNRKKVSIVCAMQHKPELLIFDEPTSGLDPLMQEIFFELLLERNREGSTCFLSSHVLPEVKKYCKHAGIIREGKLISVDTVSNLVQSNVRKGKLVVTEDADVAENLLKMIPEVKEIKRSANEFYFTYKGNTKALFQVLATLPVEDMLFEEPSLEEAFMHFYENGGEKR